MTGKLRDWKLFPSLDRPLFPSHDNLVLYIRLYALNGNAPTIKRTNPAVIIISNFTLERRYHKALERTGYRDWETLRDWETYRDWETVSQRL